MKLEISKIQKLRLTNLDSLDPVDILFEDFGPGQGQILIRCYGQSWTSYWGSMGCSILEFFSRCNEHYLSKNLFRGDWAELDRDKVKIEAQKLVDENENAGWLLDQIDSWSNNWIDHKLMTDVFGDGWWDMSSLESTTSDYEYFLRILAAAKEGVRLYLEGGHG